MSAKNKLQEIYQKQQIEMPVYMTVNMSNQPHAPVWKAQVKTVDGHSVWSKAFPKKTQAENDAAQKCLKRIVGILQVELTKYVKPENPKTILLIDLENVQTTKVKISAPDLHIIGFVGKYNRGILKDREWLESMMELVITDTVCDDAADHALTFHVGTLQAGTLKPLKWIILSSDHFAAVPIEFLKKSGHLDSHSVTNVDDLKLLLPECNVEQKKV